MSWAAGDLDDARRLYNRALDLWPKSPLAMAPRSLIEYEVGSFEQGEIFLGRLIKAMRDTPPGPFFEYAFTASVVPVIARIAGGSGRFEVAEEAADAMLAQGSVPAIMAVYSSVGLALIAAHTRTALAARPPRTNGTPAAGRAAPNVHRS